MLNGGHHSHEPISTYVGISSLPYGNGDNFLNGNMTYTDEYGGSHKIKATWSINNWDGKSDVNTTLNIDEF